MNKINNCLSKRHCDVIGSNVVTNFGKLNRIFSLNIFNAEKSVGGHVKKIYNFVILQQNHILLGS